MAVGTNRELPGSLPGPSRWEKRPGRIATPPTERTLFQGGIQLVRSEDPTSLSIAYMPRVTYTKHEFTPTRPVYVAAPAGGPIYRQYADATGHAPPLRPNAFKFWQSRNRYKSSAIALSYAAPPNSVTMPSTLSH